MTDLCKYRLYVRLFLAPPVLSHGLGGRALGLDAVSLRDREGERPALPGTLVRGNLRHALCQFHGIAEQPKKETIVEWFGAGRDDPSELTDTLENRGQEKSTRPEQTSSPDYEPRRGLLFFDEYWVCEDEAGPGVRNRIRIDRDSGAVGHGKLQLIEEPYAPGAPPVVFSGSIWFWEQERNEGQEKAQEIERWIRKALQSIPALGAYKGMGFGRLSGAEVSLEARDPNRITAVADRRAGAQVPSVLGLALSLDRPFCFTRNRMTDDNLFLSHPYIPGGAIKGAMASRLCDHARPKRSVREINEQATPWPLLCRHFDKLRLTHALPAPRGHYQRPVAVPLSFCYARSGPKDRLHDVALRSGAGLVNERAPLFAPDWKTQHEAHARERCGFGASLRETLQIRNAIDPETGAVAENKLFALEGVVSDTHHWLAELHLSAVPEGERVALIDELDAFFKGGLDRLGKTKAEAVVRVWRGPFPKAARSQPWSENGDLVITLQSDARLLLPKRFLSRDHVVPPTNGGASLLEAYREAWMDLSKDSLCLRRFYASQHLVGGMYWWGRFGGKVNPSAYNPELLTGAGSVFVFAVEKPVTAKDKLDAWLVKGLPQADKRDKWDQNPYTGPNGYGEIAVNLELHWQLNPSEESWHALD